MLGYKGEVSVSDHSLGPLPNFLDALLLTLVPTYMEGVHSDLYTPSFHIMPQLLTQYVSLWDTALLSEWTGLWLINSMRAGHCVRAFPFHLASGTVLLPLLGWLDTTLAQFLAPHSGVSMSSSGWMCRMYLKLESCMQISIHLSLVYGGGSSTHQLPPELPAHSITSHNNVHIHESERGMSWMNPQGKHKCEQCIKCHVES